MTIESLVRTYGSETRTWKWKAGDFSWVVGYIGKFYFSPTKVIKKIKKERKKK